MGEMDVVATEGTVVCDVGTFDVAVEEEGELVVVVEDEWC
jgi:RIO-like serine/threonine protein kinase